jgi:hypothetical protein
MKMSQSDTLESRLEALSDTVAQQQVVDDRNSLEKDHIEEECVRVSSGTTLRLGVTIQTVLPLNILEQR